MTTSATGWLTVESAVLALGLVGGVGLIAVAVAVQRLRRRGRSMPSSLPWVLAGAGAAGLFNVAATLLPVGPGLALNALSLLTALVCIVGTAVNLRRLRRDREH